MSRLSEQVLALSKNSHYLKGQIPNASLPPIKSSVKVLDELRGQSYEVKNLENAFSKWPFKVNEHLDALRTDVGAWLDRTFPHHPKITKLKGADYELFGATWWPLASRERLQIGTYLAIWLFLLDDEIDMADGEFYEDLHLAAKYREDALTFVRSQLGLSESDEVFMTGNAVIDSFGVIGEAIRSSYSIEQRQRFLAKLSYFVEKSEVEQRLRLDGRIISLDEFWRFRLGSSAVPVVLCINEYCNDINVSQGTAQCAEMGDLWDMTNINICMVNDLLSMKKEIQHGSAESLIPILYAAKPNVQVVAHEVVEALESIITEFNTAAAKLIERERQGRDDTEAVRELLKFVEGCRYYCTGNLSWSLSTERYGVHQNLGEGKIIIQL